MTEVVEEIKCRTAAGFVSRLRKSHEMWWDNESDDCQWIFRGQWDVNWPLLPSAWRPNVQDSFVMLRGRINSLPWDVKIGDGAGQKERDVWTQTNAEVEAILQYCELCDSLGFPVQKPQGARPLLVARQNSFLQEIPNDYLTAAGLAQHHGIPTRLLDWTSRPLNAAFFAVAHRFRGTDQIRGQFGVWAVHLQRLNELMGNQSYPHDNLITTIESFKPAQSDNRFLHAQGGLFLRVRNPTQAYLKYEGWPTVNKVVSDLAERDGYAKTVIRKIVAPLSQADSVLTTLDKEDINDAILMPTMDMARETLQSRWLRKFIY